MNRRRLLLALGSAGAGAVLVILLLRFSRVNVDATLAALRHASPAVLLELLLLNALLVWLSTLKWRAVDRVLRRPGDAAPSRISAFFVTSAGMALGLVLPVQIGMTISRTLGTHFYGRAFRRGTGGTLFEQAFDLLIVLFLAVASALTSFFHGSGLLWIASALAVALLSVALAHPWCRLAARLFHFAAAQARRTPAESRLSRLFHRLLSGLAGLEHTGIANAALVRRLLLLSAIRFCVVVLMATRTAAAIHAAIPFWRMAAAMPFATLANLIGITPGGVGINELASVSLLHLFGTPLGMASDWALANRLLGTLSGFAVAACGLLLLGISAIRPPREVVAPHPAGKERANV